MSHDFLWALYKQGRESWRSMYTMHCHWYNTTGVIANREDTAHCDRAVISYKSPSQWGCQGVVNDLFWVILLFLQLLQAKPFMYMNSMKLVIPVHVIVLVNSHQRWKQTCNRVCFHLWCELTLALWCHSIVRSLLFIKHNDGMMNFMEFMFLHSKEAK